MFVSSFTTYTVPTITQKAQSTTPEKEKDYGSRFKEKLSFNKNEYNKVNSENHLKLPLDYVSTPKTLQNHYRLQQHLKENEQIKYKKMQTLTTAKSEYIQNSTIFPLILKPKPFVLKQTQQNPQLELKNSTLKAKMINTYIENENYYKITA